MINCGVGAGQRFDRDRSHVLATPQRMRFVYGLFLPTRSLFTDYYFLRGRCQTRGVYQRAGCLLSTRRGVQISQAAVGEIIDAAVSKKAVLLMTLRNDCLIRGDNYIIDAIDLIASYGHQLLADYHVDPRTGRWRHHAAPAEPPLRLTDVRFGPAGPVSHPHRRLRAGEDVLDSHLLDARNLLMARATGPGAC